MTIWALEADIAGGVFRGDKFPGVRVTGFEEFYIHMATLGMNIWYLDLWRAGELAWSLDSGRYQLAAQDRAGTGYIS